MLKMAWAAFVLTSLIFIAWGLSDKGPPRPTTMPSTETKTAPKSPAPTAAEIASEQEFQRAVMLTRRLRDSMKNPASFQLESAIKMADGSLCLTYRATNSFNAIVLGRTVVTAAGAAASNDGALFPKLWNQHCGNKTGSDITYLRRAL